MGAGHGVSSNGAGCAVKRWRVATPTTGAAQTGEHESSAAPARARGRGACGVRTVCDAEDGRESRPHALRRLEPARRRREVVCLVGLHSVLIVTRRGRRIRLAHVV
eukprot:1012802-Prymnesium_polylepis.1